ncbi:hypothetical protein FRB94_013446 [Tulasnella sp. JGI-2019a]|nr:hypothetical protein FRB94_013446 [Tulasnella sp. JGI-2019a]
MILAEHGYIYRQPIDEPIHHPFGKTPQTKPSQCVRQTKTCRYSRRTTTKMTSSQPVKALVSGFYYYTFGILEPILTLYGAAAGWTNTSRFFHDQIPSTTTPVDLDPRANIVAWQLAGCYLLIAMIDFMFFQSLRRVVTNAAS